MSPVDRARAELVRHSVTPRTLEIFDQLVSAFFNDSPAASLVLHRFDQAVSRISAMSPEQALARLAKCGDVEAVGVLKIALAELADVKALDCFVDLWGPRAKYALRRNVSGYSVIFFTGQSLPPPTSHGSTHAYARRAAAEGLRK